MMAKITEIEIADVIARLRSPPYTHHDGQSIIIDPAELDHDAHAAIALIERMQAKIAEMFKPARR